MHAFVITEFGGPECLEMQVLPDPAPQSGHVLIAVKAFGLNRAELYFRSGAWGDVARVSGIECVGTVIADPQGDHAEGDKVIALMGGMGRTINGSYAQLVSVPSTNVVAINSKLSWAQLAAIPESYATAWACLNDNLSVAKGQTLLIRGATSALGRAAMNIAVRAGVKVIGTTRRDEGFGVIKNAGATPVLEKTDLSESLLSEFGPVDAVLDIVGNQTIVDSLASTRSGGKVCLVGFLGGGAPIVDFNPLTQMPSGVQFSFFASAFVFGTPDFPLAKIPFQELVDDVEKGLYDARPAKEFAFDELPEAHRLMEDNRANGKLVVRV